MSDSKPNRRQFLAMATGSIAALAVTKSAIAQNPSAEKPGTKPSDAGKEPFTLAPLPYPYEALEPVIDVQTMRLHHDKHHAAYVANLNKAVAGHTELAQKSAVDLIKEIDKLPENVRAAIRNNAGGHVNHSMFWDLMAPGGAKAPEGALAEAINNSFGSFDEFKKKFEEAGTKQFGSGWAWLIVDKTDKSLKIVSTPNQDNPISQGNSPILGNDVWEHAYYLKYQNRRADYLKEWWKIVNWTKVDENYKKAI